MSKTEESNYLLDVLLPGSMDWIQRVVSNVFDAISTFVVSNVFTVMWSTLLAAFAGAYGAHYIIENNRKKEELLKEIRITNAAIMVSFSMFNTFFRLKKQYVFSIYEKYEETKAQFLSFRDARSNGQISNDEIFDWAADLRTLPVLTPPSEVLEKQIFEGISSISKELLLTATLIETIQSLNSAISQRNELIRTYLENPNKQNITDWYFGLRNSEGHVNEIYPDLIDSI